MFYVIIMIEKEVDSVNTDNQNNNDTNNNVSNSTNNTNLNSNMGSSLEGTNFPKEDINNQVLDSLFQEPSMQSDSLTSDNQNAIMNHGMQNEVPMQNEGQEQAQMNSDVQNTQVQNEVTSAPQINSDVQSAPMQNDVQTVPQMNQNVQVNEGTPVAKKKGINKIVLIIAIVIALVVCGVVVLLSLPKKGNVTRIGEYRGEPKTIYLYKVSGFGPDDLYQVYDEEQKSSETGTYELVKKYDCKTSCPAGVSYNTNTLAFYDDGVFYEYDIEQDKINEKKSDFEHKFKNYLFRGYDRFVLILSSSSSYIEYNDFDYFDILPINDDEEKEISLHGSIDTLKDGMLAMEEDNKFYVYRDDKLIHEEDIGDNHGISFSKEEGFYFLGLDTSCYLFTKEKKLPVELFAESYGERSIINNKLIIADEGKILTYDTSANENVYEVDYAYAVVENYAVVINNGKLELYDAVDNKVVHAFDIDSNLKFLDEDEVRLNYTNEDGEHTIEVFLMDITKDSEIGEDYERIFGKTFEYDFNTETAEIEDGYVYAHE